MKVRDIITIAEELKEIFNLPPVLENIGWVEATIKDSKTGAMCLLDESIEPKPDDATKA